MREELELARKVGLTAIIIAFSPFVDVVTEESPIGAVATVSAIAAVWGLTGE